MKYAYFQNSLFIILIKFERFYVCSLQIQIYTSRHVKEIEVHAFMHGTVSLVFPELFNLKVKKCLKLNCNLFIVSIITIFNLYLKLFAD